MQNVSFDFVEGSETDCLLNVFSLCPAQFAVYMCNPSDVKEFVVCM